MAQNLYISTLLTIVIDVSPNDGRDRIDILKSAKLALKSLVKDRKLPSCAEVRIVLCNRWDRQGVTIKNQNGAFRHPSDQSEILNDIQRIRGIGFTIYYKVHQNIHVFEFYCYFHQFLYRWIAIKM